MKKGKKAVVEADTTIVGQQMINQTQATDMMKNVTQSSVMLQTMAQYQNFKFCKNHIEDLKSCTGALIRQQQIGEIISSSEVQNKYIILLQSEKEGLQVAFKCNVLNDSLKMKIFQISSQKEIIADICPLFATAEYSKRCLCCCKTRLKIDLTKNQNRIGGAIELSDKEYEIYDEIENIMYKIVGNEIYRNDKVAGYIREKIMSIGSNTSKVLTYNISFPEKASPETKFIIICAVMLMDSKAIKNQS